MTRTRPVVGVTVIGWEASGTRCSRVMSGQRHPAVEHAPSVGDAGPMTSLDVPVTDDTREAPGVLVPRLRAAYTSGRTRSLEWRHEQLAGLKRMLTEREAEFTAAL